MNLIDSASLVVTPNAYKTSKLYSIVPTNGTGDLTFSRTGDTATRVNSAGLIETVLADRPRLDYLGSNCPKLLLEPQRTNLLIRSEELDNGSWSKSGATVSANQIVSPDGTTDADKIVESNTNAQHFIIQSISLTASTTYTISAYLKAGERTRATIRVRTIGGDFDTLVDLVAGTADFGTLTSVGNGWFRFARTITTGTGTATQSVQIFTRIVGSQTYQGDGTSGVYVWGTQLEQGSFVSSYIPTTTATVTRNADSCTKTSISSLLGQTEGVIFFDVNLNSRLASTYFIIKGTSGNDINILINNTSIVGNVNNGGVAQAAITHTNSTTGRFKIALAYKLNDIVMYVNGVQIGTDSSATIPATTEIDLFNGATNSIGYNSASIWKTRLTNQELATLTTI
jgi:hypothetical protein